MLRVSIIAVGNLKEKYLRDACAEYMKRLQAFCKLELIEIQEAQGDARAKEGERIISRIKKTGLIIALAIEGNQMASEEFADFIGNKMTSGVSDITFIIGGSTGLSPEVLTCTQVKMSFSKMTFPHQLMRVILLEQIYRGFTILQAMPYHK